MIKMFCFAIVLGFSCLQAEEVLVQNPKKQRLWGAMYYVQSYSAQRVGPIKRLDGEKAFILPSLQHNARRYLIVSRNKKSLKELINQPSVQLGISRIAVDGARPNASSSDTRRIISVDDLPIDIIHE